MQVCGDRFQFGVGAGSTQKDFDALGRDYETRFRTFAARNRIAANLRRRQPRRRRAVAMAGRARRPTNVVGRVGRHRRGTRRQILFGLDRIGRVSLAGRSDRRVATLSGSRRTTRGRLHDSVGTHHRSRRNARDVERIRNRRIRRRCGDVVAGRPIGRRGAAAALTEALKGRQASIGDVQSKRTVHAVSQYVTAAPAPGTGSIDHRERATTVRDVPRYSRFNSSGSIARSRTMRSCRFNPKSGSTGGRSNFCRNLSSNRGATLED